MFYNVTMLLLRFHSLGQVQGKITVWVKTSTQLRLGNIVEQQLCKGEGTFVVMVTVITVLGHLLKRLMLPFFFRKLVARLLFTQNAAFRLLTNTRKREPIILTLVSLHQLPLHFFFQIFRKDFFRSCFLSYLLRHWMVSLPVIFQTFPKRSLSGFNSNFYCVHFTSVVVRVFYFCYFSLTFSCLVAS